MTDEGGGPMLLTETVLLLLRNPETPDYAIRDALQDGGVEVASVYVVTRCNNSYSDYYETHLAAFLDKDRAEGFLARCEGWAAAHGLLDGNDHYKPAAGWPAGENEYILARAERNRRQDAAVPGGSGMPDYARAAAALPGCPDPGVADHYSELAYQLFEIPLRGDQ